ncbi:hypothetical protein Tco_1342469 [Tanacetum coccineum]
MTPRIVNCLGRKAYLLEDKQIPSVGVFDEVVNFSFRRHVGRISRDLGSLENKWPTTTDLTPTLIKNLSTVAGCVTASQIQRCRRHHEDQDGCHIFPDGHLKTLSLDESRSPDFDLFSDQEEYSEEEVAETMAETIEQYMSKNRAYYGSGVARPKIEDKDNFELKG